MKTRSKARKAKTELVKREVHQVFALVIVNEKFDDKSIDDRPGAETDRRNINQFCKNAKFSVNKFSDLKLRNTETLKTDNLTGKEMGDLFKSILTEGDFSSYDAFVCFTSSHGNSKGILGVDGDTHNFK